MTSSSARQLIRDIIRSPGGDTTEYTDSRLDRAINAVGLRFVRNTRITRTTSTLTLTIANNSLPSFPAGFAPQYALRARLTGNNASQSLKITDYDSLLDLRQNNDKTGAPTHLAFSSLVTGEVWPKPDFAYAILLNWFEPFNSTTYNIPDDLMNDILIWGVIPFIQHNQPEQLLASQAWQEYLKIEANAAGLGGLGVGSYEAIPDPDGAIEMAGSDRVWTLDANGNPVN